MNATLPTTTRYMQGTNQAKVQTQRVTNGGYGSVPTKTYWYRDYSHLRTGDQGTEKSPRALKAQKAATYAQRRERSMLMTSERPDHLC